MRIDYDTKIWRAFGVKLHSGPRVGIELEYENANIYNLDDKRDFLTRWTTTDDPSLRGGGVEFVSRPTAPQHLEVALEQVKEAMDITGAKATKRCGVHVHLNVTDLSFREMWGIATYYTLLEPFIFKEFADGREDSHFCVPTWANTTLQQSMYHDASLLYRGLLKGGKNSPGAVGGLTLQEFGMNAATGHPVLSKKRHALPLRLLSNAKYSAMNFTSLEQWGTIEFRQHTATVDMRKVHRWCEFLLNLRSASMQYTDANAIIMHFDEHGFSQLCGDLDLPQSPNVDPLNIEDAVDAAYMIVGHPPTDKAELNWEIK